MPWVNSGILLHEKEVTLKVVDLVVLRVGDIEREKEEAARAIWPSAKNREVRPTSIFIKGESAIP